MKIPRKKNNPSYEVILLEKDSRSVSEIVSDIMKNGKTEIGIEANKDNVER